MVDSLQDLYAKNLQQSFGYPLRFPEPKPGLPPSYQENGLHIGDVGYVDRHGMFEVLFNICFASDHDLHRKSDLVSLAGLTKFNTKEAPPIPTALPSGHVICHGIEGPHGDNLKHAQSAPFKFMSRSTSGAILILPSGAVLQCLNENKEEEFCTLAEKNAPQWCRLTGRKSLYLITGFYKTSSWHLASFRDVRPIKQTLLERDDMGRYIWNSGCHYRQSPRENRSENQTVLISGFKIEMRDNHAVIEKLTPRSRNIWSQLILPASFLVGFLVSFWQWIAPRSVLAKWGRVPASSQPFHPSDVINRYLLDKNPSIPVAVTHDNQWLTMLEKNELPHEEMMEEKHFRAFLEDKYTADCNSDNVICLRRKIDEPNSAACSKPRKSALSPKTFSFPAPSDDIRQIVITRMRVENAVTGLRRMPVGFYVLVQFDGTKKRSKIKSVLLYDSIIEWDAEIILPTDSTVMVRFSIHASFEFEPTLGNGEILCVSEISVGELAQNGSTYFSFSSTGGKDASSCPSLLITLEERRFDSFAEWSQGDSNLGCEDRSCVGVGEATDEGHDALLRYHRDHKIVELKDSVECFKHALDLCPSYHECRTVALFNFATAKFINCQAHGTIPDLEETIASYREVLVFRPAPLPDRPGTLLQLAQALLYCYGRLRCDTSVVDEIKGLMTEVKQICCEGSYEHRAANLVLQTLKRYQAKTSGQLVEIDQLISNLDWSARMSPDWYFDQPYRLINLSAVLRKRFEITGDLDCLEKSISVIEEAAQLIPDGHFDKPWVLASLGDALCVRFVRRGDVADLDNSIPMIEDAVNLTPDGHVERPWMLSRLGAALLVRFMGRNASDLGKSISMTGSTIHLTPKARLNQLDNLARCTATGALCISDLERAISMHRDAVELLLDGSPHRSGCLTSLAGSLLIQFWCLGNLRDLEEAVSRHKDAVEVTPNSHPDKPDYLNSLALSLRARFERSEALNDLEEAVARHKEAIELTPDGHPRKPGCLGSLGSCFYTRFERLGERSDLEDAISRHKDAVELIPDGHPGKPGHLINLALSLSARFKRFGEPSDLEEAISRHKDAVKLTPDGHPDKPDHLNNLALSLRARFERFGEPSDLEEAILRHKDAVELTPDGHPDKPDHLNNLALSLKARFERFEELSDLEEAIARHMDAIELTPDGHPGKSGTLGSLGNCFVARFKHFGELSDLENAILRYKDAIELTPDGHPGKPGYLGSLGNSFVTRFEQLSELGDLEAAISRYNDAVELTPDGHPDKPGYLNLALSLTARLKRFRSGDIPSIVQGRIHEKIRKNPLSHVEVIDMAISEIAKLCPLVLIDVETGLLCDKAEREHIFKEHSIYRTLLSSESAAAQPDLLRIVHVVAWFFRYVMFSHTWEGQEPTFQDVSKSPEKSVYKLDPSSRLNKKLGKFCEMVRDDPEGYRWSWSDTCCIDKTIDAVYKRSICFMYNWYKWSALTLVLLADISNALSHNLKDSRWMTRAWTLQELLSPKTIRFYDCNWKPYRGDTNTNHKESPRIMRELAEATKVAPDALVEFSPEAMGVREKLRLASTRSATIGEDIAYSLLGIFVSDLIPEHRDPEDALGLLLQEIINRHKETTVLDWTGEASKFNSCLPAHISVYSQLPFIAGGITEKQVANLGSSFSLQQDATEFYDRLDRLDPLRFAHCRLHLPCITFPILITKCNEATPPQTRSRGTVYLAKTSALGDIEFTTTKLVPSQDKLVLVYPWIRDLRTQVHLPKGDPQAGTEASRLLVYLNQGFTALLLAKHPVHNKYRRIASDNKIFIPRHRLTSLKDVGTERLEIQ